MHIKSLIGCILTWNQYYTSFPRHLTFYLVHGDSKNDDNGCVLAKRRAAGEEKWRLRRFLDQLLVGTPHSNLAGQGCEILVGWYPPSGGVSKQLLLAPPHLGVQGGGASKELEYNGTE